MQNQKCSTGNGDFGYWFLSIFSKTIFLSQEIDIIDDNQYFINYIAINKPIHIDFSNIFYSHDFIVRNIY